MIIDNISKEPQTEYYVPLAKGSVHQLSYFKAKDKKGNGEEFDVRPVESDPERFVYTETNLETKAMLTSLPK